MFYIVELSHRLESKLMSGVGRLNETSPFVLRQGVFYGQCSEICGVGHGNMPIVVEAVTIDDYVN